jgi:hypothetical protein
LFSYYFHVIFLYYLLLKTKAMDDKVFPNHNQVPSFIRDIAKDRGVEGLTPGETAWLVPWAVKVGEVGIVQVDIVMERSDAPGGTLKLKVISDFDGLFIDASALSREDIQRYFSPRNINGGIIGESEASYKPVGGVIYPLIKDGKGLNPIDVRKFNDEQEATRKKFADHFKSMYGREYVFADDEISSRTMPQRTLGETAIQHVRNRWGRSR